jgi:hypothetical protein
MDTIEVMSRNIFMCASDLSVITGHNPYKDKSEITLKYWKKHFKADYVETKLYMKNNKISEKIEETYMECIERISRENNIDIKSVKTDLYKCLDTKNTENLQKEKDQLIKKVLDRLPQKHKEEFKESVNHITNTQFGIRFENNGVEIYQQKTGNSVEKCGKYHKEELFIIDNEIDGVMDIWTVGGKVDGIAIDKEGNKIILEIKNRVNRLFNTIRDYEKIQCYAYMYTLDINSIHLAEILKSRKTNDMNIFEINFDEDFWQKEIVDNISLFVDDFYEFLNDKKRKIALLKSESS